MHADPFSFSFLHAHLLTACLTRQAGCSRHLFWQGTCVGGVEEAVLWHMRPLDTHCISTHAQLHATCAGWVLAVPVPARHHAGQRECSAGPPRGHRCRHHHFPQVRAGGRVTSCP